ncbi:pur operon repressor [Garciella nitratireducens]|uniref:pur operon repressor n=1 Tax=Garciella nitratireducens TaxID=218205 RepID=UPI000DE8000E|nr:pur operon repressor [Garciella nitratireducens]RBP40619.1 purine operon repressor PurR [Garciella nitratireducens]
MKNKKRKRTERIGVLIKILNDHPNKIFTLNYFCELLGAAKSSISEDIMIAKNMLEDLNLGIIETIPGAAGGVKYLPVISKEETKKFLQDICFKLEDEERVIPGGFIYMTDIIYSPENAEMIGKILATQFINKKIDYVLTMETKGIPIAMMGARSLGVPLVIVRRDNKVTEGSTVSINYVSGSSKRIQTMFLSRRALSRGAKVLIIDDFMKAGGTAKGMTDLVKEFEGEIAGIGVLIATKEPKEKVVEEYVSLLYLENMDLENKKISIMPNPSLL